jgi:hypothetical protein
MRSGLTLLATLLVFGAAGTVRAATWIVFPDGSGDAPDIQAAITAAAAGDTVCLADGTFAGSGNRDLDFAGKPLLVTALIADGDTAVCVIDAQGTVGDPHRGFWFRSGEDSTSIISHLTITGGGGVEFGGGILCGDPDSTLAASPLIRDCLVRANEAINGAGIAVVNGGSEPLVRRCRIENNDGDGVYIGDGVDGSFLVDCRLERNVGSGFRTAGSTAGEEPPFLNLLRCTVRGNDDAGVRHEAPFGRTRLVDCTVDSNGVWGVVSAANQSKGITIVGGRIAKNDSGGVNTAASYADSVVGCEIADNRGPGITTSWDIEFRILSCTITGNDGHGIATGDYTPGKTAKREKSAVPVEIVDCVIAFNEGRGIDYANGLPFVARIDENLIFGNASDGIAFTGECQAPDCALLLESNTITENLGHGLLFNSDVPCTVRTTIMAGNSGEGLASLGAGVPVLACSDIFGNGGGDWTGPIASALGIDGNFSADPYYCGADYTLLDVSPCQPGYHPDGADCGVIGARGGACIAASVISEIEDVGNDQGRNVYLDWAPSFFDATGSPQPIVQYEIYRRREMGEEPGKLGEVTEGIDRAVSVPELPAGVWDYIAATPAHGEPVYHTVMPTLEDSTALKGVAWTAFLVRAATADPYTFYDSAPDSGYSVDNLAPSLPAELSLTPTMDLVWGICPDEDFQYFTIYGSAAPALDESATLIDYTTEPLLGVLAALHAYYHVTATDFAGNEGPRISPGPRVRPRACR